MAKVVATWLYQQHAEEGGAYAQVRGDSSTESFRDVYRRCVATFFATARRAVADAELVLFLNVPWDPSASAVSAEVDHLLRRLQVRTEILNYTFAPPPSWPPAWRNQFFVFDILRALASGSADRDELLVLDSDVVWSGAPSGAALWDEISMRGALTYRLEHGPDEPINGCSRRQLTALANSFGLAQNGLIEYSGGEFIALRRDTCREVLDLGELLWPQVLEAWGSGVITQLEEGHLLSLCYAGVGVPSGAGNSYVKRIWTQPFKYKNVEVADLDLALWHVPAEKKYGLRRLYPLTLDPSASPWTFRDNDFRTWLGSMLGIPRNGPGKIVLDVSSAARQRIATSMPLAITRAGRRDGRGTTPPLT